MMLVCMYSNYIFLSDDRNARLENLVVSALKLIPLGPRVETIGRRLLHDPPGPSTQVPSTCPKLLL